MLACSHSMNIETDLNADWPLSTQRSSASTWIVRTHVYLYSIWYDSIRFPALRSMLHALTVQFTVFQAEWNFIPKNANVTPIKWYPSEPTRPTGPTESRDQIVHMHTFDDNNDNNVVPGEVMVRCVRATEWVWYALRSYGGMKNEWINENWMHEYCHLCAAAARLHSNSDVIWIVTRALLLFC